MTKRKAATKVPKDSISLTEINPAEYNPRRITEDHLALLMKSVEDHTSALADWDPKLGYRLASTVTINRQGNRIVGGHQRVRALEGLGQPWIHEGDVTWIDLPPEGAREKALNVALNSPDAAGEWDYPKLQQLLEDIQAEDLDLSFTALSGETLAPLLPDFSLPPQNPLDEWKGMPSYESEDQQGMRTIIVHFKSGDDIKEFVHRLGLKVTDKTKSVWFPYEEPLVVSDQRWVSEEELPSENPDES